MEYMTIKQLADEEHVTYEAIRKSIAAHRKELEGHIVQKKSQKLLDEYAVKLLKSCRRQSPVVVVNEERIKAIDELQAGLLAAKEQIIALQEQIAQMHADQVEAAAIKVRYELTLEDRDRIRDEMQHQKEEYQARIDELTTQRDEAQAEAASYTRTWFGLYRKH